MVVQVIHRSFIIYVTLQEASNWKSGHPTALLKDWLEDDMGYAIYLPILILELIDAGVRIGISVRNKDYVVPSAVAFIGRSLPDLAVVGSIIYLNHIIVQFSK